VAEAASSEVSAAAIGPPGESPEVSGSPVPQLPAQPEEEADGVTAPAMQSPPASEAAAAPSPEAAPPEATPQTEVTPPARTPPTPQVASPSVRPRDVSAPSRPAKRLRAADDTKLLAGWQALLERTRRHPQYAAEYSKRFETDGATWARVRPIASSRLVLAVDCEMVYAKDDPNALARVSVVSFAQTLLDAYVRRAPEEILDYRTPISGVEAHHLLEENGAMSFEAVQEKVLDLISPETILVGHALQNDLRALRIVHHKIVDTALLFTVEGKNHWQKHKLHNLVSLMRPKVATLQTVIADGAHDSRQDAEWALQIALYEASIHPRSTEPLKLQPFPTKIFLSEIPQGTAALELQALFAGGDVSEISYQLQGEPAAEWQGRSTVTFPSQGDRDAAISALARFVCVSVGPLRDWAGRWDIAQMQRELIGHFSRFGRIRGCRVFRPRVSLGKTVYPVAQLNCHPATARALLTTGEAHSFPRHRSDFKVHLDEEAGKRRCVVPLGNGHFVARIQ